MIERPPVIHCVSCLLSGKKEHKAQFNGVSEKANIPRLIRLVQSPRPQLDVELFPHGIIPAPPQALLVAHVQGDEHADEEEGGQGHGDEEDSEIIGPPPNLKIKGVEAAGGHCLAHGCG